MGNADAMISPRMLSKTYPVTYPVRQQPLARRPKPSSARRTLLRGGLPLSVEDEDGDNDQKEPIIDTDANDNDTLPSQSRSQSSSPPTQPKQVEEEDDGLFLESFRQAANAKLGAPIPPTPFEAQAAQQAEDAFLKAMQEAQQEFAKAKQERGGDVDGAAEAILKKMQTEEDLLESLERTMRTRKENEEDQDEPPLEGEKERSWD